MPQTVTATVYRTYKSKASLVAATHSAGSPELLTINHRLGACPDDVRVMRRTVIAYSGAGQNDAGLCLRSWNASQVLLDGVGNATTASPGLGLFDIVCERYFSAND